MAGSGVAGSGVAGSGVAGAGGAGSGVAGSCAAGSGVAGSGAVGVGRGRRLGADRVVTLDGRCRRPVLYSRAGPDVMTGRECSTLFFSRMDRCGMLRWVQISSSIYDD